jgi:hypothetical protein
MKSRTGSISDSGSSSNTLWARSRVVTLVILAFPPVDLYLQHIRGNEKASGNARPCPSRRSVAAVIAPTARNMEQLLEREWDDDPACERLNERSAQDFS